MKATYYSYRYAKEILQHENYIDAWNEITRVFEEAPLFTKPGKSSNSALNVVQQIMNVYFDRRFVIDLGWKYHPLATEIENAGLRADFRKTFNDLTIQTEVQFGNMARWYSDIFKFQTAYSQNLIQMGLSVVPTHSLAKRTDSNVAHFERAVRELPSAQLSITLPILLVGLEPDDSTSIVNVRECSFDDKENRVTRHPNPWRVVNGYIAGVQMKEIGPDSPIGPTCS
jgi:hypothetical protein